MLRERVSVALGLLVFLALLASVLLLVTTTIEHFRASRSPAPAPSFLTAAAAAMLMYRQPPVGLPAQSSGPEPVRSPGRGAGRYCERPVRYGKGPTADRAVDSAEAALALDVTPSPGPPTGTDASDAAQTRPAQPDALAPHPSRGLKAKRQAEMREICRKSPPPPRAHPLHPENRRQFERLPFPSSGSDSELRPVALHSVSDGDIPRLRGRENSR